MAIRNCGEQKSTARHIELQQKTTTLGSTPVGRQQESQAIIRTGDPKAELKVMAECESYDNVMVNFSPAVKTDFTVIVTV